VVARDDVPGLRHDGTLEDAIVVWVLEDLQARRTGLDEGAREAAQRLHDHVLGQPNLSRASASATSFRM
jgi:hypothetical protein